MRQRSCQTDLHVARVPRGTRAMPVNEKPRVSRGDGFLHIWLNSFSLQFANTEFLIRLFILRGGGAALSGPLPRYPLLVKFRLQTDDTAWNKV